MILRNKNKHDTNNKRIFLPEVDRTKDDEQGKTLQEENSKHA